MVITENDPENYTLIDTIPKRGALCTCSYEEEICTDSQSLFLALQSLNPETDEIRFNLKDH